MTAQPWAPRIRALLYPIQFDPEPVEGIDRVLATVVDAHALGASPADYLEAIASALASDEDLGRLLPAQLSDATVRQFLREVERRIKLNLGLRPG